jgi:hypothetical protein
MLKLAHWSTTATWKIPAWLDRLLPRLNIEGTVLRARPAGQEGRSPATPPVAAGPRAGVAAGGAEG